MLQDLTKERSGERKKNERRCCAKLYEKTDSLEALGSVASFLRNRKFYLINDRSVRQKESNPNPSAIWARSCISGQLCGPALMPKRIRCAPSLTHGYTLGPRARLSCADMYPNFLSSIDACVFGFTSSCELYRCSRVSDQWI